MTSTPPFVVRVLRKILGPLEIISLLVTIFGLAMSNPESIMIGLSLLATTYFLMGYIPLDTPAPEKGDEPQRDFFHLLATSIAVKVSWIASAAALIGSTFRLLHLNGALEMLMVGCSALAIAILIMGIYAISRPGGRAVVPVLYRALPVFLFGVYLFMNNPA